MSRKKYIQLFSVRCSVHIVCFCHTIKAEGSKKLFFLVCFLAFRYIKNFSFCLLHDMKFFFFILDYFVLSPICAVIEYVRAFRSRRKNIQLIFMIETSRNLMSGLVLLCATIDIYNHLYKLNSAQLNSTRLDFWRIILGRCECFLLSMCKNDFVVSPFFRSFVFVIFFSAQGQRKAVLSLLSIWVLRVFCGVGRYK